MNTDTQMTWQMLLDDPAFCDRPFDVETTERGQIIVTPVNDNHAYYVAQIVCLLHELLPQGVLQVETPLTTARGTKSPDVTWCSQAVHEKRRNKTESPIAPEICVEVLSPSNAREEMEEKIKLYFEQGAQEVWLCQLDGHLEFFTPPATPGIGSKLCPDFPKKIEI